MMKKQKSTLLGVVFILFTSVVFGQDFNGFRQSNYSGVSGGDLNPANIADNRMVVDLTLLGFSATAYNNHAYINPHLIQSLSGYANIPAGVTLIPSDYAKDSVNAGKGYLFEFANPNNNDKNVHYNHNIDIFNLMISVSPKMAFSIGMKNRAFVNVANLSPDLLAIGTSAIDSAFWTKAYDNQSINFSATAWNEFDLGFAMVVLDKEEHFIKVGTKLKVLQGMGAAYMGASDMSVQFLNADTATVIDAHFNYGYSDNFENYANNPPTSAQDVFKSFSYGFGADLGVVYEWRPDWKDFRYDMDGETNLARKDRNKYKLKFSFAINDIGGINYKKGGWSKDFIVKIDHKHSLTSEFPLAEFDDTKGVDDFNANVDSLIASGFGKYGNEDSNPSFFMNLPTHISTSVDWNIWNAFYLNANAFINLNFKSDAHKVTYPTSFSLTPRYDFAWAGISIPMSYNTLVGSGNPISGFKAGIGLRMGPLVIGTSDLKPLLATGKDRKIAGADIYFALKIPILRRHPKDKDLDKVSDKVDLCKTTPGVWEFKGCPDTDGDGIQDSEDTCPTEAGLPEFQGCPDTDGDKVIDIKDECPETPGSIEFNGCPDTDGDKIIDKNDDCPEVAGIATFNGCPDTDGDGIKDSEDLCPENAGPLENNGCPDTDNDGIFDYLDECPEIAGPQENNGCPWPDTDGDGLLDKDDKCPYNAGPAKNEGCPYVDTDGDGILDKDDECVNVPGTLENKGCPEIQEEEQEILNTAFENLEFESAKAVIKDVSYASLEELAALLVKKPDWKLKVSGHTDSQGAAQTNLIISKKRAQAVKDFLTEKGVNAESIIVQYFGETKPIADNNTAEGRQKNRRVEMEVIFE